MESENITSNVIPFKEVVTGAVPDVDKSEKQPVADILPLPTQLVNYRNKNFFGAVFFCVIGIGISCFVSDWRPLLLMLLFAGYMFYTGFSVQKRYRSGTIVEVAALCTGIKPSSFKDRVSVTFAAKDEEEQYSYFNFVLAGRKRSDDFMVGSMYAIYFDKTSPHTLIGYLQI